MKKLQLLVILSFFVFNLLPAQTSEVVLVQSVLTKDYSGAVSHFETIENKEPLRSDIHYLASISYIKQNKFKEAINQLSIAARKGLTLPSMNQEVPLDALQDDGRYEKVIQTINKNAKLANKELLERHRQLALTFEPTTETKQVVLEMTGVKHQGNRNTCSVFAATSIAEYLLKEENQADVDLSEAYSYYIAKKKALNNTFLQDAYKSVDGLAGYLALDGYSYGAAKEADWPYESNNWLATNHPDCEKKDGIPSTECFTGLPPDQINLLDQRFKTVFIPFEQIGDYILTERKPVLVNIWLYRNGINMQTGALSIPPKGEELLMGGHVVTIIGYDAEKELYFFKNSWGSTWGNQGYGTMPKSYLEHHYEASKSLPFNLDASEEEKDYLAKVSLGASLVLN